jgi:hypothetical protein
VEGLRVPEGALDGRTAQVPCLEVPAPRRVRRGDAEVGGGAEAEPPVVLRRPEQGDQSLVGGLGHGRQGVHQRRPDAVPLVVRVHAERSQPEDRMPERLEPATGGDHVPDDLVAVDRDQREVRQEAGVLS